MNSQPIFRDIDAILNSASTCTKHVLNTDATENRIKTFDAKYGTCIIENVI